MALFINEDDKQLTKNQVIVPDKLVNKLDSNVKLLGKYKDTKGFKRIKSIVDKTYNKRSDKKDRVHNDKSTISFSDLKRIDHDMRHTTPNDNNIDYVVQGGSEMKNWAHDTLRKMRTSVKPVKQVPKVSKLQNDKVTIDSKPKDIQMGKASVRLTEMDDNWPPYYDVMSETTTYHILDEYYNQHTHRIFWEQIDPNMYSKALSEFTKYGKLIHFPEKYVYQWMGMMMRNTAKLSVCTNLAGHSTYFPKDEILEFFTYNDEIIDKNVDIIDSIVNEYHNTIDENNIEKFDFEEWCIFFDETGFYGWMTLPDGSDGISDYGIEPLEKIIFEYKENMPVEKVLVLINKMLDVTHCRGDLSSMFIVGGRETLSQISEEVTKSRKKIKLTESQLLLLKERWNELVFNFDDDGEVYFEKDNWQHFIDFLEEIGEYGYLPDSGYKIEDIEQIVADNYDSAYSYKSQFDYQEEDDEDAISRFIVDIQNAPHPEEYFTEEGECFLKFDEWMEENGYANCGNPEWCVPDFIESLIGAFDIDRFEDFLSSTGFNKLEDYKKNVFISKLDDYGFPYSLTLNDRGLIYIERELIIPKYNSPDFDGTVFYYYLKNKYGGIGEYWTWDEGSSEAYNGSSYGGQTTRITLKGWVSPKDVSWEDTVYKNAYNLNQEREIYIPSNSARVELFAVEIKGKNALKQPIIVPTTW